MNKYAILLLTLILGYSDAFSQSNRHDRIVAAEALFLAEDMTPNHILSRNEEAEVRHVQRNPLNVASERMNAQGLLNGYSAGMKVSGMPYWTSEKMLKMQLFDGENVYLENQRIYNIKPNVVGWIGVLRNVDGSRVGLVRFEIIDNDKVFGHFDLPGRFKMEIEPQPGSTEHDIVQLSYSAAVDVLADQPETRTEAEMIADEKAWEERLAGSEYDQLRQDRIEQLQELDNSDSEETEPQ